MVSSYIVAGIAPAGFGQVPEQDPSHQSPNGTGDHARTSPDIATQWFQHVFSSDLHSHRQCTVASLFHYPALSHRCLVSNTARGSIKQ